MNTLSNTESIISFFNELGIDPSFTSHGLTRLTESNSKYLQDMKLNVSVMLASKNLTKKEAFLVALSVAANEKNETLIRAFEKLAANQGATPDEVAETHACTSIMNVNNVLYRFRHYMHDVEYYQKTPAGLRMSVMMAPTMGKSLYELISLAISAINGCERCVQAHEHTLKEQGTDEARIYDAIRLAAVIKGLCVTL